MKKRRPAIPRYMVLDTKTGEVADNMSTFRKHPKYSPLGGGFLGRTARRFALLASWFCLVMGVSYVLGWLYDSFLAFAGVIAQFVLGIINVAVAVIVGTEWFKIDERLEACDFYARSSEYWEEQYIDLARKVENDERNRQA